MCFTQHRPTFQAGIVCVENFIEQTRRLVARDRDDWICERTDSEEVEAYSLQNEETLSADSLTHT